MAQWWDLEHLPPTNVPQLRFPELTSYVGRFYCWFSFLLPEFSSQFSSFPPSTKSQHFKSDTLTWKQPSEQRATPWTCHSNSHLFLQSSYYLYKQMHWQPILIFFSIVSPYIYHQLQPGCSIWHNCESLPSQSELYITAIRLLGFFLAVWIMKTIN